MTVASRPTPVPGASGRTPIRRVANSQVHGLRITPGAIHLMEAVTDCDVLEASTPHLDDVVRLKDRYGREGTSAA